MGNFLGGLNLTWQLDIYRQLRNARDAAVQRYVVASEKRNYFVTRLVAEIAENYYRLMAFDKRIENLNQIIALSLRNLEIAKARMEFARGNQLGVLRFEAEVRRNQSEKLIVNQDIVVAENRINFLVNRYPQPVERDSSKFYDLTIHPLYVGVPSQLLQNRPDIRQAERDLAAAGLDVKVARINFFPQLVISSGGFALQAFSMRYLFEPQAVVGDIAAGLVGPLVNKRAIRADYLSANAKQLQTVYNYQRVILNAFTEVINRMTQVENYSKSIEIKKQQLKALEASVDVSGSLFQLARTEYIDVLLALQALFDARVVLLDTKREQLSAFVNAYQALGGGVLSIPTPADFHGQFPYTHTVRGGENFRTIALLYYRSEGYWKAALGGQQESPSPTSDRLAIGGQDHHSSARPSRPGPDRGGPRAAPPPPGQCPLTNRRPSPCHRPRHRPQACLARSGPEADPKDPAAVNTRTSGTTPPRPRRSRRRRGSERPIRSRFVATCQLSGSPGSGWSGRRMRLRSTPTSRCDSTECLSGRSRCTS